MTISVGRRGDQRHGKLLEEREPGPYHSASECRSLRGDSSENQPGPRNESCSQPTHFVTQEVLDPPELLWKGRRPNDCPRDLRVVLNRVGVYRLAHVEVDAQAETTARASQLKSQ